jgi:hypothetical protein
MESHVMSCDLLGLRGNSLLLSWGETKVGEGRQRSCLTLNYWHLFSTHEVAIAWVNE